MRETFASNLVLSPCDLAFECVAFHHFLTALTTFAVTLILLLAVLVEGAGVVKVEKTRQTLRSFGHLYVTRDGLRMVLLQFLEACRIGR